MTTNSPSPPPGRRERPGTDADDVAVPHTRAQERVLDVLEALSALGPRAKLTEIAERCGLPKPTVHRILALLNERGYASQGGDGVYGPGLKLLALAGQLQDNLAINDLALPAMREIQDEFPETVHFGVLEGTHAVYVAKLDGRRPYRLTSRVGMELSLHCTSIGKAILSAVDPGQRDALLRPPLAARTERTITNRTALLKEIQAIARRGYAIDDEENERDVRCVAAPVVGSRGLYGALSISAPAFAMPMTTAHMLGPVVIGAAGALSTLLSASLHPHELL
jgi:IclR family transcriptional regulator, acetate operon repressor